MFYDIFLELCNKNKTSPYRVSKETGIPQSTISMWKKTGGVPQADTLKIISDYFSTSTDYLLTGEKQEKSPIPEGIGEIGSVYLSMAKKMQDAGIHPDDIEYFIELNKRARERNDKK